MILGLNPFLELGVYAYALMFVFLFHYWCRYDAMMAEKENMQIDLGTFLFNFSLLFWPLTHLIFLDMTTRERKKHANWYSERGRLSVKPKLNRLGIWLTEKIGGV